MSDKRQPWSHKAGRQHLTIQGKLPGLNDILRMRGRGHHAWNRKKKQLEEEIGWEIRRHKLRPVRRAHLAFLFYEFSRRRDPDNIQAGSVKIILDALVKYGILENDGWDQIAGISATFSIDKENPRVEVLIDDRERDTGT